MSSNDLPRRTARTCTRIEAPSCGSPVLDGEVGASCKVDTTAPVAVPACYVTSRPEQIPYNLLLESLIEHLCQFYEPDTSKRRQLFTGICERLKQSHLFDYLPNIQELYHLRFKFGQAFSRLVIEVKSSLSSPQSILGQEQKSVVSYNSFLANGPHPIGDLAFINLDEVTCQKNRYQSDFEDFEKIAEGGFGIVCKAKKRVDSCVYAIKMIPFKYSCMDLLHRVLKEVELLAQLCHPNIVAYKTAWIENQVPIIAVQKNASENTSTDTSSVTSYAETSTSCSSRKSLYRKQSKNLSKSADVTEESSIIFEESASTAVGCSSCTALSATGGSAELIGINFKSDCGAPKVQQEKRKVSSNASTSHLHAVIPAKDSLFHLLTEARIGATLFIQMELCSGNLADWISTRNQRFPSLPDSTYIDEGLSIFKQIVKGVQYIHAEGLIHRDLKPHNIMFDRKGSKVKIGDFGLATMSRLGTDADLSLRPWIRAGLHTRGVGTDLYAAPEQRCGGVYNFKADIFSLGIILTELICPFKTGHERISTLKMLHDGFPIPPSVKSQELRNLISRMCCKDPAQRPTATEVLMSTLFKTKDELLTSMQEELVRKEQELVTLKLLLKKKSAELEWYQANCHCGAQK